MKPLANLLKLNVDAAYSDENRFGTLGAIIRGSKGGLVAASARFIPHTLSASMAEAIAMQHGLKLANLIRCHAIEAESDSIEVVQYSAGDEPIFSDATGCLCGVYRTS
jgi:ribonuclease HI